MKITKGRSNSSLYLLGKLDQQKIEDSIFAGLDLVKAKVRVKLGENLRGWLPWLTTAGHLKTWNPPVVGEQVVVLSPGGDLEQSVVLPEEVQGIRAFGSKTEAMAIADVLTDHLTTMRNKHAITLEHLRMGALKGKILDADGSVLYNLFDEFDITEKVVNFGLSTANTNVKAKCLEVVRHIEDSLRGEVMSGIHALVSAEFFDALTNHPSVKEAYERWQEGAFLRDDFRSGFPFGGITFEEYRGQATDPNGTVRRFIAQGEGHAFPVGTAESFVTYFAPADFNETVNTLGRPLYAKQELRRFDRGTDLHTQSNPLPLCLRPAVLVKFVAV